MQVSRNQNPIIMLVPIIKKRKRKFPGHTKYFFFSIHRKNAFNETIKINSYCFGDCGLLRNDNI